MLQGKYFKYLYQPDTIVYIILPTIKQLNSIALASFIPKLLYLDMLLIPPQTYIANSDGQQKNK